MTISRYSRTYNYLALLCLISSICFSCAKTKFRLPGELLLSSAEWDHILFSDGLTSRELKLQHSIAASQVGPDGRIYALSSFSRNGAGDVISNSIVVVQPDGSTVTVFAPPKTKMSFSATPTALVVLAQNDRDHCPTIDWVHYEGTLFRSLPAPCGTQNPQASTEDLIIVTAASLEPSDPPTLLMLLRGTRFENIGQGYEPVWINSNQYMYQDTKKCIHKQTLGEPASTTVLCDAIFEGAASPDGRYVVVHVPGPTGFLGMFQMRETKELRVVDTRTGRYIPLYEGAVPYAFWAVERVDHH
jgi:hypothetical protein